MVGWAGKYKDDEPKKGPGRGNAVDPEGWQATLPQAPGSILSTGPAVKCPACCDRENGSQAARDASMPLINWPHQ